MKTRLYIPTRGRAVEGRQVTLREFKLYSTWKPVLVCPPDEYKKHLAYWPHVMVCRAEGIGPTRQWIMERSTADIVIVMSDDIRFSYRPDPALPKLEKCENLDPMVEVMIQCVKDGYVHGAVSVRQGNNHYCTGEDGKRKGYIKDGHAYMDSFRANEVHFMHRETVVNVGARWDALTVMEDFHFTLTMLTNGYQNRIIYDYAWNQEGSNAEGGCSLYRTPEVQTAAANALRESYPDFVRVVQKTSKDSSPSWRNFKTRTDVNVSWWKAFLSAPVKHEVR